MKITMQDYVRIDWVTRIVIVSIYFLLSTPQTESLESIIISFENCGTLRIVCENCLHFKFDLILSGFDGNIYFNRVYLGRGLLF